MAVDALFWDNLAEKYAAKPVEKPEAFDRKTEITKAHLTPDSVVLDVGCGTGSLALRLAPHLAHIHGLDVSGEMLRIARGKAKGTPNATFHQGTLNSVTFEPASLDGVCAYSILHLVEDLPATLSTMYSLVKPGGFFISSTVVLGGTITPYWAILPVMKLLGKAPMVKILKQDALTKAIEEAGFVNVSLPDVGAQSIVSFVVAHKPD